MNNTLVDYFQKFENEKREGKNLCDYYSSYTEIKEFFDGDMDFLTFFEELFSSYVNNSFFCKEICPYLDNIKKRYRELQEIDQITSLKEIYEVSFELSFFIDLNFKIQFDTVDIVALDSENDYIFSINYDLKEFKSTVEIVDPEDTYLSRKTILNFETKPPADLFLKVDLLLNQAFFKSIGGDSIIKEIELDFLTYEKYRELIIIDEC